MGSELDAGTGSKITSWQGSLVYNAGGECGLSGQKITHQAGPGGQADTCSGGKSVTVLGMTQEQYAQLVTTAYATGKLRTTILGVDGTTVISGGITRQVLAGVGMTDTCAAGNHLTTVAAGNLLQSVGTGNFGVTVGAGSLALTSGAGPIAMSSSLAATITSGVLTSISSPATQIGIPTGFSVAGAPGPPGPMLDYIVGIPLLGIPTIAIG
jgi:hypothetical protein